MDCGGKRSATPLCVEVTPADEPSDPYCLGKRRRASLAAALQNDFADCHKLADTQSILELDNPPQSGLNECAQSV